MTRSVRLSTADLDALARIVDAEAGNQPAQGKLAVMFTVLNRAASGAFPSSVRGVIEQRNQFEPMIGKRSVFDLPEPKPETISLVSQAAAGIANGEVADPTNGATFFQNVAITNQRGTNFAVAEPVAQIGDHSFYNRYKLNNPVKVEPFTVALEGSDSSPTQVSAASPNKSPNKPLNFSAAAFDYTPHAGNPLFAAAAALSGEEFTPLAIASDGEQQAVVSLTEAEAFSQRLASGGSAPHPSDGYISSLSDKPRPQTQGQYSVKPTGDNVDLSGVSPDVLSAANQAASIFGSDLSINSGYRSQAHQDRIRHSGDPNRPTVAKHSHHTSGSAIDISTAGMSRSDQARLIDALAAAGFTGFGHYDSHIHADFRSTVPSSFGSRANWAGWTNMPEELMAILKRRGFAPGVSADQIKRGQLL